jgi:hypothetical protein
LINLTAHNQRKSGDVPALKLDKSDPKDMDLYSKTKGEGKAEICYRHCIVNPILSPPYSYVYAVADPGIFFSGGH